MTSLIEQKGPKIREKDEMAEKYVFSDVGTFAATRVKGLPGISESTDFNRIYV